MAEQVSQSYVKQYIGILLPVAVRQQLRELQ